MCRHLTSDGIGSMEKGSSSKHRNQSFSGKTFRVEATIKVFLENHFGSKKVYTQHLIGHTEHSDSKNLIVCFQNSG